MTHPPQTPAGWYDDGSGRKRWWDGTAWGQYADVPPPTPPQKSNTGVIIGFVGFLVVLLGLGVLAFVLNITGSSGAEKAHESVTEAYEDCDTDLFREVTSRSFRRYRADVETFEYMCEEGEGPSGEVSEAFDDLDDFHDWCQEEFRSDCLADPRRYDGYAESLDDFTGDPDEATVIVERDRNRGDRGDLAFFYSKIDGDWVLELIWSVEDVYADDYYDDDYYDDDYYYSY